MKICLPHEDEEGDCEYEEVPEVGDVSEVDITGPSFAPVFTGILDANGNPIIRHPVVIRMGFHTKERNYYCPTMEDNSYGQESVVGWVYDGG